MMRTKVIIRLPCLHPPSSYTTLLAKASKHTLTPSILPLQQHACPHDPTATPTPLFLPFLPSPIPPSSRPATYQQPWLLLSYGRCLKRVMPVSNLCVCRMGRRESINVFIISFSSCWHACGGGG